MTNLSWFWQLICFSNLALLLCVSGQEITVVCNPENDHGYFSSHDADGVIYDISKKKLKSTRMDASIICTTNNFHVKVEWLVYDGRPKALQLVLSNDTLSQLHNSMITCCMLDIRDFSGIINRAPHFEKEKYYNNMTGAFNYKCGDGLTIKLEGIELLVKDFSEERILNRVPRDALAQKDEDFEKLCKTCVENGNNPPGKIRDNVGVRCDCPSNRIGVLMHNEKQELVCSVCCPNQHFSTRRRKCERCADCSTNQNRSLRTSCIHDPHCKRPSTPNELTKKPHTTTTTPTSTINRTTPTSTTNTTTPTSTTNTTSPTSSTDTTSPTSSTDTTTTTGTTTSTSESEIAKNDESGRITVLVVGFVVVSIVAVVAIAVILYFVFCKPKSSYARGIEGNSVD